MECRNCRNVRNYLCRFDQILNDMGKQMLSTTFVDSITIDFIQCMVPHHQAAIYMCQNLLQYTCYQPLVQIANGIIQMQTKGIEQMKQIARTTVGYHNTRQDVQRYREKYCSITKEMLEKMQNSPRSKNINFNFVGEMIPHHEGAVAMCENLLQYGIDPRLKVVAESIIREQSEGIEQLKDIRRRLLHQYR